MSSLLIDIVSPVFPFLFHLNYSGKVFVLIAEKCKFKVKMEKKNLKMEKHLMWKISFCSCTESLVLNIAEVSSLNPCFYKEDLILV